MLGDKQSPVRPPPAREALTRSQKFSTAALELQLEEIKANKERERARERERATTTKLPVHCAPCQYRDIMLVWVAKQMEARDAD